VLHQPPVRSPVEFLQVSRGFRASLRAREGKLAGAFLVRLKFRQLREEQVFESPVNDGS
jgi:hypothetical protein